MGKFKDWLKKSKILSNAAKLIPFAGPAISDSIDNMGYGKRRRGRRGRRNSLKSATIRSCVCKTGRKKGNVLTISLNTKKLCRKNRVARKAKRRRATKYRFASDGKLIRSAGLGNWLKKGFSAAKKILTKDNIKKGIEKAKEINNTLKEKKYISNISNKVGDIASAIGFDKVADIANKVHDTSAKYGYGKTRGGLKFKQNGGLKFKQNGGLKLKYSRPINNGLAKPCGFNKKGIYKPQVDLENFLAYSIKNK